ncbi:hypothetical protein NC651_033971 [Populus alba x Populus x berolinensis]|nr:hypothetical protein NC651_033971 [Populus alba x Populus x berolinensis]
MVMLLFDAIFIFLSDLPKYQIPKPREILFTSTVDFALIFVAREKIMTTPRKEIKRESRREKKAETAAELDKSIEKELLERLNGGLYGDIHNILPNYFNKILDENELDAVSDDDDVVEPEIEYVQGYDDLEEEDDIEDFSGFAIDESLKNNDDAPEDEEEMDTVDHKRLKIRSESARRKVEEDEPRKSKKKARVLVEVENEDASERQRETF